MNKSGVIIYKQGENDFDIIDITKGNLDFELNFERLHKWKNNYKEEIVTPNFSFYCLYDSSSFEVVYKENIEYIEKFVEVLGKGFSFNIILLFNEGRNNINDFSGKMVSYVGGYMDLYERIIDLEPAIEHGRIPKTVIQILKIVAYGLNK